MDLSPPQPDANAPAVVSQGDRPGAAAPLPHSRLQLPALPTMGALSLGAFAVCCASGIVLLAGYEPARPLGSTLAFELERPFGWFFRALHAWSAHLMLLTLVAHTIDYVLRRADRQTAQATWTTVVASLPLTVYLMLGGYAMTADAEGRGVGAVLHGILCSLPLIGRSSASLLVGDAGGDPHVLMTHHVASATLLLVTITVIHLRRLVPDVLSLGAALGLSGLVALFVRPALADPVVPQPVYGPWFMRGLRWLLEVLPVWLAAAALPAAVFALLVSLPALSDRAARVARHALGVALVGYAMVSLWAVLR